MTPSSTESDVERVRSRRGMYVTELKNALFELVGNSFDEFLAGAATRISVDIDGRWATVEDDGRGMPVELIEPAFLKFHDVPTLDGHQPHVHLQAGAMGVIVVNAVSERLELETRRDGVAFGAVFSRGKLVEPVRELGPTASRGTRTRFQFDAQLFDEGVQYDVDSLKTALQTFAWLAPKLDLRFQGESLQKTEGPAGWLRELAPNLVSSTVLSGVGTVDGVDVEVAFGWQRRSSAPVVKAFVNYGETDDAESSNRRGLISAVRTYVRAKRGSKEMTAHNGLVAVVNVGLLDPKFGGPTKARLEMKGVEKAVNQVVMQLINSSPSWWHSLHEAMR